VGFSAAQVRRLVWVQALACGFAALNLQLGTPAFGARPPPPQLAPTHPETTLLMLSTSTASCTFFAEGCRRQGTTLLTRRSARTGCSLRAPWCVDWPATYLPVPCWATGLRPLPCLAVGAHPIGRGDRKGWAKGREGKEAACTRGGERWVHLFRLSL